MKETDLDNIVALAVKKRPELGEGRVLETVRVPECSHRYGCYVNEKEAEVTCRACGTKLNPIWVLQQLCHEESRWHSLHARYQDEMKRLKERSSTKCQHCQKMTRISPR
jgi:ribosomal protein S27E